MEMREEVRVRVRYILKAKLMDFSKTSVVGFEKRVIKNGPKGFSLSNRREEGALS